MPRNISSLIILAAVAALLVACSDNGPPAGGIRVDVHADQPASAYDAYVWSLTTRDSRPVLHTDWTLTDADLVACDAKTTLAAAPCAPSGVTTILAAAIHPFARERCGDGVDQNCNGPTDETCQDADGDGDPDDSDCAPNDPRRHHAQPDP